MFRASENSLRYWILETGFRSGPLRGMKGGRRPGGLHEKQSQSQGNRTANLGIRDAPGAGKQDV